MKSWDEKLLFYAFSRKMILFLDVRQKHNTIIFAKAKIWTKYFWNLFCPNLGLKNVLICMCQNIILTKINAVDAEFDMHSFVFFIKRKLRSLLSFTFFIKERCILCILLRSL